MTLRFLFDDMMDLAACWICLIWAFIRVGFPLLVDLKALVGFACGNLGCALWVGAV